MTKEKINRLIETEEIYMLMVERADLLRELVEENQEKLAAAPKDSIQVRTVGKNKNYAQYCLKKADEKSWKYITEKSNEKLIGAIVNRDYNRKICRAAVEEQKNIERFMGHRNYKEFREIWNELNSARKKWITSIILPDDEYVKEWCSEEYSPMPFGPDDSELYSKRGERVRSKTERMIANTLFEYGIPYRYEYPLIKNNMIWARPDFVTLNVKKRKTYYWEHFGMMDDSNYAKGAVKKISTYMKNGIFQGEMLISTYETTASLLNESDVITLIKKYLL